MACGMGKVNEIRPQVSVSQLAKHPVQAIARKIMEALNIIPYGRGGDH